MTEDVLARFMAKVDASGPVSEHRPDIGPCWQWTGYLGSGGGYGYLWVNAAKTKQRTPRLSYEHFVGPIPDGLEIDHLCRNRGCVNPAHLEAVTTRENMLRGVSPAARHAAKTHCENGHEFTSENTGIKRYLGRASRRCLTCHREKQRYYRDRDRRAA